MHLRYVRNGDKAWLSSPTLFDPHLPTSLILMICEVLCVLAGYDSSLFTEDSHIIPEFRPLLHPGEVQTLESLAELAAKYRKVKSAATHFKSLYDKHVLSGGASGSQRAADAPSEYLSTLGTAMIGVLKEYEDLIVETEARVLKRGSELVGAQSFVPLSSVRAVFSVWDGPLAALDLLVSDIYEGPKAKRSAGKETEEAAGGSRGNSLPAWPPGPLIDLLLDRARSGVHRIAEIMSVLAVAVQRLWRIHLTGFLLHGILSKSDPLAIPPQGSSSSSAGKEATPTTKSLSALVLNTASIPTRISAQTRESILYVGKAMAIVKNQGYSQKQLPKEIVFEYSEAFEKVLPQDGFAFDRVVAGLRTTVSEFLWAHVLKEKDVEEAVESLSQYFLVRNGEFAAALIREIERLKVTKLLTPSSRSSGICEQDLSLALLRASLGTTAQHDPSLSKIQFNLPAGPIKPFSVPKPGAVTAGMISEFSDYLLGTPLILNYALQWPLDLFLVPSDLQIYSHLFAYFSAIRRAHHITSECWTSLSNSQRSRRRWTGPGSEGGTEDSQARQKLLRCGWGVLRQMLWFLDTLWGYLMNDVAGVQYRRFQEELKPPPVPSAPLEPRITPRSGAPGKGKEQISPAKGQEAISPRKAKPKNAVEKEQSKSSKGTDEGDTDEDEHPRPESVASDGTKDGTILARSHHSVRTTDSSATSIKKKRLHHLDFSTLRLLHSTYLRSLLTGSLLADPTAASTIRGILDVCNEFVGQIERWGGDVLPALLSEGSLSAQDAGVGKKVKERWTIVKEIDETLNELLHSFYQHLTESMAHGPANGPISADASVLLNASTTILGLNVFRNLDGKQGAGMLGKDGDANRQLEHLLLRLDFNSAMSTGQLVRKTAAGEVDGSELLDES